MSRRGMIITASSCIAVAWLPYVVLRLYWEHLLATVPGAAHGEVSGPILYFLPRLMVAAAVFTALVFATAAWKWKSAARPSRHPSATNRVDKL
jgi:hypothetical protein